MIYNNVPCEECGKIVPEVVENSCLVTMGICYSCLDINYAQKRICMFCKASTDSMMGFICSGCRNKFNTACIDCPDQSLSSGQWGDWVKVLSHEILHRNRPSTPDSLDYFRQSLGGF